MTTVSSDDMSTLDLLAESLHSHGIRNAYGLPGGCTANLVGALERVGVRFTLTHSETAAVFMAATEAELVGRPGLVLVSLGPGLAAAANGVAHCLLDRVPLLLISDRLPEEHHRAGLHQYFDHGDLLHTVAKASLVVGPDDVRGVCEQALRLAMDGRPGPVHLDLPASAVGWTSGRAATVATVGPVRAPQTLDPAVVAAVREATAPLLLAGLGAARLAPGTLDSLADDLRMPVLTTYKGKGSLDESGRWSAGVVTGGYTDRELIASSDLLVLVGLDPIELLSGMEPTSVPTVVLTEYATTGGPFGNVLQTITGRLQDLVSRLPRAGRSERRPAEATDHRLEIDGAIAATPSARAGLHPWRVAEILDAELSDEASLCVDAGAHMLPVCQGWRARRPGGVSISNGLSSMAYALPAGIARSMLDPCGLVVVCTGDGGLLMALGELATAARHGRRLVIVVFDDSALSLIQIKQKPANVGAGVDLGGTNWRQVAEAFGIDALQIDNEDDLRTGLAKARQQDTPTLVAVTVDPSPYAAISTVLRGR